MSDREARSRRKRHPSGHHSKSPAAKRLNSSSDSEAKQHSRKVIKAIYRRYNVLNNPDADGRHLAFDALLDACEGEPAARRLAARLIPRFASQFQGKHSTVARSLMELSAWDSHSLPQDVQKVAQQARLDAFRGLGGCCLCTADDDPGTDRTSASVILHLLRCLHQPKGFKREAQNFPEHDSVLSALHQIFLQSPKTMLAACFESLSSGSGELYDSAFEALDSFISPPECLQSMYKTNSSQPASLSDSDDSNKLQWRQDERLLEWLIPTAERLQDTSRNDELATLLDRLLQAVSNEQRAAKPESFPPETARTPARLPAVEDKSDVESDGAFEQRTDDSQRTPQKDDVKPSTVVLASRVGKSAEALARVESGELDAILPNGSELLGETEPGTSENNPIFDSAATPASAGMPLSADALPRAGLGCCLAFECLLLSGIQTNQVDETQIKRECEDFGPVKRVVYMYAVGQAFVFFHDMSDAIACYEGMNGNIVLSRKPISIDFCEDSPEVASQTNGPLRLAVWLAMYDPQQQLDDALNELRASGVPKPTKVVDVGGTAPGSLLYFSTPPAAAAAVVALRSSAARDPTQRPRSPMRDSSLSPRRTSPSRGRSPVRQFPPGSLPEFATRTLWIGQVGPDIEEEELIDAFKKHGRLQGYKLIRGSNCGFIDFERVEDAASAREALHEATFASCQLRVEFKEEGRALGRLGPPAPFAPRGRFIPRGRGRGRGRFDAREPWPANNISPPGFRGRGRFGWRGGRGRHPYDWNDGNRFDVRSPVRSPSPFNSRSRQPRSPLRSPDRRSRYRTERGRPSPDYTEGGKEGERRRGRSRSRSRTRRH